MIDGRRTAAARARPASSAIRSSLSTAPERRPRRPASPARLARGAGGGPRRSIARRADVARGLQARRSAGRRVAPRSPAATPRGRARSGDESRYGGVLGSGTRLGIGIANVINTFDPDVVAIGGGVSEAGDLFLPTAIETARGYVLPGVGTGTQIRSPRRPVGRRDRRSDLAMLESRI